MLWWFQEFTLRLLLDKRGNILGFKDVFNYAEGNTFSFTEIVPTRPFPNIKSSRCQKHSLIKAETCRCVWRQLVIMLEGDWKRKRTQWEFNFTLHFYKRVVVFSVHSMWSWVSFLKPTVKGLLWSVGSLEVQRLIQTSKTSKVNHWLTQWIRNECSILCR